MQFLLDDRDLITYADQKGIYHYYVLSDGKFYEIDKDEADVWN